MPQNIASIATDEHFSTKLVMSAGHSSLAPE